jgi:hypothetical protein
VFVDMGRMVAVIRREKNPEDGSAWCGQGLRALPCLTHRQMMLAGSAWRPAASRRFLTREDLLCEETAETQLSQGLTLFLEKRRPGVSEEFRSRP